MRFTVATTPNPFATWIIIAMGGLLALALRWHFVTHAQVLQPLDNPNVQADAADYYRYAWNLLHHAKFAADPPGATVLHPSSFRDPGYAIFLAAWMAVTSSYAGWYAVVLLSQAVLGAVTVVLLLLALRGTASNLVMFCTAILMACWPHSVAAPAYVLTETFFGFLCASTILALRYAASDNRHSSSLLAGLVLGIAALTNAILIPFGLVMAVALFLRGIIPGRAAVFLVLSSLALPSAWALRSATAHLTSTSTHRAAMNLVQGSWPSYHDAYQLAMKGDPAGRQTIRAINNEVARFDDGTLPGLSLMIQRMEAAPLTYAAWYARKPALLWGWDIRIGQGDIYVYPTRQSPFAISAAWKVLEDAYFLANPVMALLAAVGALHAVLRRQPVATHFIMAMLAIFATLVYGVLQSEPRYATPFRGLEAALACLALPMIGGAYRKTANAHHDSHNVS